MPATGDALVARVIGEVELEDRVLVVRRIHVTLQLKAAPEHREVAERVRHIFGEPEAPQVVNGSVGRYAHLGDLQSPVLLAQGGAHEALVADHGIEHLAYRHAGGSATG